MTLKIMCPECRNEQDVDENIKKINRCIVCGTVIAEPSESGTILKARKIGEKIEIDEETFLNDKNKCELCGEVSEERFLSKDVPTHFVCFKCWMKR